MLEQLYCGPLVSSIAELDGLGLIFTSASWGAYYDDRRARKGIGHNGIVTPEGTVIHACARMRGVTEISLEAFLKGRELRHIVQVAL